MFVQNALIWVFSPNANVHSIQIQRGFSI